MPIIKGGPFGNVIFMDEVTLLPVDHRESPTDWHTLVMEYEQGEVIHVYPNNGAHSYGMRTDEDGFDLCTCHCTLDYDIAEDGSLMVIHDAEPEIMSG